MPLFFNYCTKVGHFPMKTMKKVLSLRVIKKTHIFNPFICKYTYKILPQLTDFLRTKL